MPSRAGPCRAGQGRAGRWQLPWGASGESLRGPLSPVGGPSRAPPRCVLRGGRQGVGAVGFGGGLRDLGGVSGVLEGSQGFFGGVSGILGGVRACGARRCPPGAVSRSGGQPRRAPRLCLGVLWRGKPAWGWDPLQTAVCISLLGVGPAASRHHPGEAPCRRVPPPPRPRPTRGSAAFLPALRLRDPGLPPATTSAGICSNRAKNNPHRARVPKGSSAWSVKGLRLTVPVLSAPQPAPRPSSRHPALRKGHPIPPLPSLAARHDMGPRGSPRRSSLPRPVVDSMLRLSRQRNSPAGEEEPASGMGKVPASPKSSAGSQMQAP